MLDTLLVLRHSDTCLILDQYMSDALLTYSEIIMYLRYIRDYLWWRVSAANNRTVDPHHKQE